MRVLCIEFEMTRAILRVEPSWLARLFEARASTVELGRVRKAGSEPGTSWFTPWVLVGSGRQLDDLDYEERDPLRRALDFREVLDLPNAKARTT